MKAKKSLGQNFLIDNIIINKIVDEIGANKDDLIIEIGPGRGALTNKLKKYDCNIIAYEIDKDLINVLSSVEDNKTKIIFKDILNTNIKDDISRINYNRLFIVGNLPYYITTPIIEHIINQNLNFEKLIIMVQKEVADRFMAKVHSKEYGYFTVLLNYFFDISLVCNVKNTSFNPAPKVDSSVILLKPKSELISLNIEEYKRFLKQCFSQKRKKLKNNLIGYNWDKIKNILEKNNLSENVRAEEISGEIFIEIFLGK